MPLSSLLQLLRNDPRLGFLQALGRVYVVGGAVRDALLGRGTKDLDFVVLGRTPEAVVAALERYGKVEEIESRAFGVYKFTPEGASEVYDVALPRRDRWTGPAYKDMAAEIGVSLEEDLGRRDFTINALAVRLDGELVDPYGGQADLRGRLIRAVGEARERFAEDPSRILRGMRLACELDFQMEAGTWAAMVEMAGEVVRVTDRGETRVAPEVVGAEFLRGFAAQPGRLVRLWEESGLLERLLPEVVAMKETPQPAGIHGEGGVLAHALLALERLGDLEQPGAEEHWGSPIAFRPREVHTRLGVLLHDVGKPATIQYPGQTGGLEARPTRKGSAQERIHFPEHEPVGARLAGEIVDRLRLSVFPRGDPLHVDRERLEFLVGRHMICLSLQPEHTRLATLERYFFTPEERGGELLALIYADMAATVPPGGEPDFSCYERMLEKLRQVAGVIRAHRRERALPHLLSGEEIMALLGLGEGPRVGEVKEALREAQLEGKVRTKEEAREWVRGTDKR